MPPPPFAAFCMQAHHETCCGYQIAPSDKCPTHAKSCQQLLEFHTAAGLELSGGFLRLFAVQTGNSGTASQIGLCAHLQSFSGSLGPHACEPACLIAHRDGASLVHAYAQAQAQRHCSSTNRTSAAESVTVTPPLGAQVGVTNQREGLLLCQSCMSAKAMPCSLLLHLWGTCVGWGMHCLP